MKKTLFAGFAALALMLAGCGNQQTTAAMAAVKYDSLPETKDLAVFNWQDYIPESLLEDFKKETGINLVYDTFGSNEEMYQKLNSGAVYDLTFPSTDYVPRMIAKGLVQKLDTAAIPEFKGVEPNLASKNTWDPAGEYTVFYNFGATALCYWTDKVKVDDTNKSWSILGDPKLAGKIMLMDDMREILALGLKYNGFSANTTKAEEIAAAEKTVASWKSGIVKFDNDQIKSSFAKKDIFLVLNYPENQLASIDEKDAANFAFFFPKEAGIMFLDTIVLLKSAKNAKNAYKFINFLLKPENIARVYDEYGYPGIYPKADAFRKQKPWYTGADLANYEFRSDVGDEALKAYEKAWENIKSGN